MLSGAQEMNLVGVMSRLYESGINCGLQSEWTAVGEAGSGGGYNKCKAEQWLVIHEFERMATRLARPQTEWATS